MTEVSKSETVTVTVHFFARARELAGASSKAFQIPKGTSPNEAFEEHILSQFPEVAVLSGHCILALNQEYLHSESPATSLEDGDELAVIPPISGG